MATSPHSVCVAEEYLGPDPYSMHELATGCSVCVSVLTFPGLARLVRRLAHPETAELLLQLAEDAARDPEQRLTLEDAVMACEVILGHEALHPDRAIAYTASKTIWPDMGSRY